MSGSHPATGGAGVTRHDPDRAYPGLNLYCSGHGPEAFLIDMDGRELHRWHYAVPDTWQPAPARQSDELIRSFDSFWRKVHLFDDGSLLAIFEGHGLIKIDRDSGLLWEVANSAHHDLAVLADGRIFVLTRRAHIVPRVDPERPILEDFIVELSPDGREVRRFSILEALESSPAERETARRYVGKGDLFHTNTLEVLPPQPRRRPPALQPGGFLISVKNLDLLAVLDFETGTLRWSHRGLFSRQHDPRLLANGNILVFDNLGLLPRDRPRRTDPSSRHSRVIELDPASGATVWEYRGSAGEPFFSATCGTAQRLANGNTLITESDFGRAFEVTAAGEIVWEYLNPHRAGENGELIAAILEMTRLPPDVAVGWLERSQARAGS